jgi:hypothetical protein
MKRTALVLSASTIFFATACKEQALERPAPTTPVAAQPAPPSQAGDAGSRANTRPLSMMERHAIWKAKKEAEEKVFAEERARLLNLDKSKLPKHLSLVAFEQKTREALDDAASKLNGKFDGADQLKKLALSQQKAIESQTDSLRAMDPQGGNSAIAGDHDVILQLLANDYPAAILTFFQGKTQPLAEVRAELDKREKRIHEWLEEVKNSK